MPTTATPEQLFTHFRATGEPASLGELFDLTSPQLLSLALHLCGNPADAEDALQATFVTAIGRAASWDAGRPVQPWLCGILTLQCRKIGERRARRREAELPGQDLVLDDGSPVAANERRELVGKLREHIDRLPQEQRQVLLLQLEHGLSPAEVAEVLGVPPGTVRMRLHRAVKALRGLMPAGLVAMLLGALPTRGLAAVRAAVVKHGVVAGVAVAGGGALLMKKMLVGIAVLAVLAIGWVVSLPFQRAAEPGAPAPATPVASNIEQHVASVSSETPTPGERTAAPAAESATLLAAEPRGALFVRVVQQASGQPVPNMPVRILPDRSDCEGFFELTSAVTGADGTCTVANLEPGRVRLGVSGDLPCFAQIRAGATATADLKIPDELCPMVPVRGRVVHHDGRPAPGAQIVIAAQGRVHAEVIAVADDAGRFAVSIARGFLLLGARLAGFAPSPVQSFRELEDVELVLPGPGAGVAGIVVDADGEPVADAVVQLGEPRLEHQWVDPRGFMMEAPSAQLLHTGSDGRFLAVDLIAAEISVFVRADGFAAFHCYARTVAGKIVEVRCPLVRGVVVLGRVVDEDGAPVVGANVCLGGTYREYRITDADGRFGYRHAVPGPQRLEVSDEGIARTWCDRPETEVGEWTVVVKRWPQFLLRFVDELGGPLVGWRVELRPSDTRSAGTDAAGRVALPAVGDGPYSLWLAPPGGLHAVMPFAWPAGLVTGVETTIVVTTAQQPAAILSGTVLGPDGAPLAAGMIEVRGNDDSYLYRQRLEAGRFRFERVPAGDWVIEVHRQGRGAAGGRFPVGVLQHREVRDLGELRLPAEGSLQVRVVLADGSTPRDASVFLWDRDGREHQAPPRDGQPHPWPEGRYTWRVMENDSLWQNGACEVRAGATASIEVVLQPAVCRYLQFPVPRPDWGEPKRIDFVLRAPDGSAYDASDFDPREEMPYRYMPALCLGTWRVELTLDDGRRFAGAFTLASMQPSREPIQVAVEPAR